MIKIATYDIFLGWNSRNEQNLTDRIIQRCDLGDVFASANVGATENHYIVFVDDVAFLVMVDYLAPSGSGRIYRLDGNLPDDWNTMTIADIAEQEVMEWFETRAYNDHVPGEEYCY